MSRVWVTRNSSNVAMPISVSKGTRPVPLNGFWCMGQTNDLMEIHTPGSFKEKYEFTPKKGSCKLYDLQLKEIT